MVPSTVAMYKLFKYPQFRVYLEWFFDDTPITELDNFQCIVSARSQEPNEDTSDIQGQNSSMKSSPGGLIEESSLSVQFPRWPQYTHSDPENIMA